MGSPNRFKGLRVHGVDKRSEARFDELTIDDLTPGEVVIRVAYSCLNYKDALAVTGKSRIMRHLPRVAGIDCSGIVESSRDPVIKVGDAVLVTGCNLGELLDGGLAEYARVPASAVVPLPAGLSLFQAMALGTAGFTAAMAVRRLLENHQHPGGGPIAVTGPTGGVGGIAITLFKRLGFEVVAITGKKAAAEDYLKQLGASQVLSRQELSMGTKPLESVLWGGAVDNLGGETLSWLVRTTRPWGNVGSVGLAQSSELSATVMPFILRGVSLLGIHSVDVPRDWRLDLWSKLAGEWKPDHLDTLIATRTIGLDDVPAACASMIASETRGRTVVRLAGG